MGRFLTSRLTRRCLLSDHDDTLGNVTRIEINVSRQVTIGEAPLTLHILRSGSLVAESVFFIPGIMWTGFPEGGAGPVGVRQRFLPARGEASAVRDTPAEGIAAGSGNLRIDGPAEPVVVAVDLNRRSGMGVAHFVTTAIANSHAHRPTTTTTAAATAAASQSSPGHALEYLRRERASPEGQQPASVWGVPSSPLVWRHH